ncbi:hypothetical protein JQX13_01215 [Archangium violaceum]|uniref:type II toxin-antitoxin system RelE family toxin n=1 Tax=Archangium violaceum TaxID=83451 RepID=UPI00193BC112|nr:hypothetical protein [Archangium violaceum]QRK08826.1 hypothetical protein JQX13_01215 [Archangium violaceum]
MHRSVYTVDISPPAWTQLAHLTLETYRRIREELDAVAVSLTQQGHRAGPSARPNKVKTDEQAPPKLSVVVDDAVVLYDVDHSSRRVLLLEVERRLPRKLSPGE